MSTAVVIGGGISGLSAAYYLQKSARFSKVLLFESSNRLGGWIQTQKAQDGAHFEIGPHSLRRDFEMVSLINELELGNDMIMVSRKSAVAKNRYIYVNKKLHAFPNSISSLVKTSPPFSKPFISYIMKEISTSKSSLQDESIYNFMHRRFGQDVANYISDPLCRGVFANDCRKLSLRSCFPMLNNHEENSGSIVRGMVKNMAKGNPNKAKETDLHKKMIKEQCATFSFRNGIQQLPDRLEDICNNSGIVEIVKNQSCTGIKMKDNKVSVTVNDEEIHADHIISSIFSQDLAKMLPTELSAIAQDLNSITAINTVVVCIELEGKVEMPVQGFGHLLPSTENGKFLGVIYDSCSFPSHDSPSNPGTRFTVMMGGAWYDELKSAVPSMDKETLGQMAVDGLFQQLGISGKPKQVIVENLLNCIPQYLIGHSQQVQKIFGAIEEQQVPISLIGSSYKGVSVPNCLTNARLAVEKLTGKELL